MKGIFIRPKEDSNPNIQMEIDWFIKEANCDVAYNESEIKKLLKNNDYDYIADWYYTKIVDTIDCLSDFGLPYITHSGDCWGRLFSDKYRKNIEKHKPSIIMVENKCSIPAFRDYLDNDDIKFIWAPHSFDSELMKDYKEDKIYDITFSGKFSNYDDRWILHSYLTRRMMRKNDIKYKRFKNQTFDDYIRNTNKSWMVYSSIQSRQLAHYNNHYIGNCFSRNFEISACKSCLVNTKFGDADYLGYKDGENCILYDRLKELDEKLTYYLDDKEELTRIINNGYDLVHKHHTIEHHTKDLINKIKKMI
jgi:hypothetical protein